MPERMSAKLHAEWEALLDELLNLGPHRVLRRWQIEGKLRRLAGVITHMELEHGAKALLKELRHAREDSAHLRGLVHEIRDVLDDDNMAGIGDEAWAQARIAEALRITRTVA